MSDGDVLRQRRKPSSGDALTEPLLGGDGASSDAPEPGESLLDHIMDWIRHVLASLGLCARPASPLTEAQKLRLAKLISRASTPYDPSHPEHVEQLRELWRLTYPSRALPALKCPEWKEMGWQGSDPATDFRSGGLMSLQNLVWFAERQPRVYRRLLSKSDGERSEWEYPFAAAGVNVTFALVHLLELAPASTRAVRSVGVIEGLPSAKSEVPRVPTTPAGVAFLDMIDVEGAFESLYVAFFEAMDREWLARRATYMEFAAVMEATKGKMRDALERAGRRTGGTTIIGVREELGLQ